MRGERRIDLAGITPAATSSCCSSTSSSSSSSDRVCTLFPAGTPAPAAAGTTTPDAAPAAGSVPAAGAAAGESVRSCTAGDVGIASVAAAAASVGILPAASGSSVPSRADAYACAQRVVAGGRATLAATTAPDGNRRVAADLSAPATPAAAAAAGGDEATHSESTGGAFVFESQRAGERRIWATPDGHRVGLEFEFDFDAAAALQRAEAELWRSSSGGLLCHHGGCCVVSRSTGSRLRVQRRHALPTGCDQSRVELCPTRRPVGASPAGSARDAAAHAVR